MENTLFNALRGKPMDKHSAKHDLFGMNTDHKDL